MSPLDKIRVLIDHLNNDCSVCYWKTTERDTLYGNHADDCPVPAAEKALEEMEKVDVMKQISDALRHCRRTAIEEIRDDLLDAAHYTACYRQKYPTAGVNGLPESLRALLEEKE